MELIAATSALAALAHPDRLAIVRLLARRTPGSMCPSEMIAALGLKPNTLSNHLSALSHAGLVDSQRSGRNLLYRLRIDSIGFLVEHLITDCCNGRPEACAPLAARHLVSFSRVSEMSTYPLNVLFICTGNSARSIMAETLLNDLGGGRFNAFSAGTNPTGRPNEHALATLVRHGHQTKGLASKDIAYFEGPGAPEMDFVFTVCDRAAAEPCPIWFSTAISAYWGLPDPASVQAPMGRIIAAFEQAYGTLEKRIRALVSLPVDRLDRLQLQHELDRIANLDAQVGDMGRDPGALSGARRG